MAISPMGGYGGIMHTHENTQAVLNRMSRAIGHMTAVKRMIEEGRDCSEVLIQLSAVGNHRRQQSDFKGAYRPLHRRCRP